MELGHLNSRKQANWIPCFTHSKIQWLVLEHVKYSLLAKISSVDYPIIYMDTIHSVIFSQSTSAIPDTTKLIL